MYVIFKEDIGHVRTGDSVDLGEGKLHKENLMDEPAQEDGVHSIE